MEVFTFESGIIELRKRLQQPGGVIVRAKWRLL